MKELYYDARPNKSQDLVPMLKLDFLFDVWHPK